MRGYNDSVPLSGAAGATSVAAFPTPSSKSNSSAEALKQEVIKREVLEGDKADGARKKVAKAAGKMLRIRKEKEEHEAAGSGSVVVTPCGSR
ncbi:MAG TPA: hypothetical protein VF883_14300 [Thermoanaerobaculia bacterium]